VDGELLADQPQYVHHVLLAQLAEILRDILPPGEAATGVLLEVLQLLVLLFDQDLLDPGIDFLLQLLDFLLLLIGQLQALLHARRQDRARGRAEATAAPPRAGARPPGAVPAAAVVSHRRDHDVAVFLGLIGQAAGADYLLRVAAQTVQGDDHRRLLSL